MDLRQLTYFVRIVEVKSFTKAAEVLHIAQPALGFQIRKLEDELQIQLLNRHSRGVEPTEAGLLLLEHARSILEAAESAKRLVMDFRGPARGAVNLGVPPAHPVSIGIIRSLQGLPHVSLNIVEDWADVIIDQIQDRRLDIGCIFKEFENVPTEKGLIFEPLLDDRLCLIGSPAAMGADLGPISFAEVAAQPLIIPRQSRIRARMDRVANALGITLDVAFQIRSDPLVRCLLEDGAGFTIRPYSLVQQEIANKRLVAREIVEPELRSRLYLVYSDRLPLAKASNAVCALIRSLIQGGETADVGCAA